MADLSAMRNLALINAFGPKRLPFIQIINTFADYTKRIIVGTLAANT